MRLQEFIERVGDEEAANLFGIKPRTAKSWRLGDRQPRPAQASKIVEAMKGHALGPMSLDDIYGQAA